jgi:hypothetical protein
MGVIILIFRILNFKLKSITQRFSSFLQVVVFNDLHNYFFPAGVGVKILGGKLRVTSVAKDWFPHL